MWLFSKPFPSTNTDEIIARSDVEFDKDVSSDGKGSVRIVGKGPLTVKLFEVTGLDVDNTRLTYEAKVKTEKLDGKAYLEMWCRFPGKGEFFSRGLQMVATGDTNWMTMETPFFLKKGEKPDLVRLNLVLTGKGTVWIDGIRLLKGPPVSINKKPPVAPGVFFIRENCQDASASTDVSISVTLSPLSA